MENFQTTTLDYSVTDDGIYYIAEKFEQELYELLQKNKIYFQHKAFFDILETGHEIFKYHLLVEQRREE